MIKILDNTYKLNQIVCVGYRNTKGNYEIISGRIYDYNKDFVHLDCSYDFWQLEDVIRIKRKDIKYIKVTINNYWR